MKPWHHIHLFLTSSCLTPSRPIPEASLLKLQMKTRHRHSAKQVTAFQLQRERYVGLLTFFSEIVNDYHRDKMQELTKADILKQSVTFFCM